MNQGSDTEVTPDAVHQANSDLGAQQSNGHELLIKRTDDESGGQPYVSTKALKLWVPQHKMNFKRAGYGVIQRAVKQLGWQKAKGDFTFAWLDRWTNSDLTIVQNWRRNHFPGE
jgi:hypothetical protein